MKKKNPHNIIVSRRQAREKVLQILYAHELTKDPIGPIIADQIEDVKEKEVEHFARKLIKHTLENNDEYEKLINETASNWDMERIAILDSIIIKMCISEFFFFPEVPTKVSINESIDLAKAFSTRNSGKFVNGVVDALLAKERGLYLKPLTIIKINRNPKSRKRN
jgi:N utilization substance protein B